MHELPQLGEVAAHEGEVVLVVEPADRPDPLQRILVAELGSEGVSGVGRVGHESAVAQDRHGLVDGSLLRVVRVDFDETRHGPDDTRRPQRSRYSKIE